MHRLYQTAVRVFAVAALASLIIGIGVVAALPARAARKPRASVAGSATSGFTCNAWSIVPSPNSGTSENVLYGVAAVTRTAVWAVGYETDQSSSAENTLTERFDGATWSVIASPNVSGAIDNSLHAVAAVPGTRQAWAVGSYAMLRLSPQTLIEHFDGTTWTIVPSPNAGTADNSLSGVAVVSGDDVWAVGSYFDLNTSREQTLIEHWNGSAWSIMPSPNEGTSYDGLISIAVVSTQQIWAVGFYHDSTLGFDQTLVEEWDGATWSVIPSPNAPGFANELEGIGVTPRTGQLWTVGSYDSGGSSYRTLAGTANGGTWSLMPSPNAGASTNYLYAVAALAPWQAWAVGAYLGAHNQYLTLIERWNGQAWSVAFSPNVAAEQNYLTAVAGVSPDDVWAVGYYSTPTTTVGGTLIEHYGPQHASRPCFH